MKNFLLDGKFKKKMGNLTKKLNKDMKNFSNLI